MSASSADPHLLHDPGLDDLANELGDDLRSRVKSELEPGERLLWAGRSWPEPARFGAAQVAWMGIGLFMLCSGFTGILYDLLRLRTRSTDGSAAGVGIVVLVLGVIALGVNMGLWMSQRATARRESRTVYAVTDRRTITWTPEPNGDAIRVRSVTSGKLRHVERVERPDGSGTLDFHLKTDHNSWLSINSFKNVQDVRRVEQIVRKNLILVECPEPHAPA